MQKAKIFSIALLFVFMLSCQALAENIVEKGLDALKNRIAAELSTLFGREVAIGKISGALLYEADLYDLEIAKGKTLASGRAFYAKKVTITYNPALMAMAKNVLPAIIKIKLEAPDLYIERNEKGEWVAPGITPGGGGEAKIPFTPKISVAEGSITFVDRRGLQKKLPAKPFEIALKGVTGFFDLKKSPDLKLELEGHLAENITSSISAKGSINTSSGVYSIKTDLRSVPASEFIPYLIAIPEIKVNRGALNSTITISGPPKAKGKLPLDIEGDATLFSIGGDVFGYPARDLSGDISILGEDIKLKNLKGNFAGVTGKASGTISSLENLDLGIELSSDLSSVSQFVPELKAARLKGKGGGTIALKGKIEKPEITGNIKISKAQAYDQNFEGEAILRFKDDLLTANLKKLSIYAGKATGLCEINFKNEVPDINIVASAEGMDLFLVSQRASETKGKISGSFALKGNLQDFVVESKGRSPEASLFGQPVNEITLLLSYKNGDTKLNEFVITSDKGGLKASGETKKDLSFYLEGESRGIKLKGESFLGNFSFKVEYFAGTISGSSLKAALSHPFLSLNVSGEAKISEGYVGDQIISAASGKIEAKEGMIKVNGLTISSGDSKLDVSGSIGLGDPTSLTLKGKEINLSDFKILNKFLPEEVGKIKGIADIDITLYGLLPKGGGFDPAKPLADLNARGRITMRNGVLFGEEVTSLEATASWEGKELQIDRFFFKTEKTEINLNGRINGKGEIDMYVSGNMDMKDIRALTRKYANISGNVYLTSKISGKLPIPDLVMDFAAKDPKYNSISLNSIKGSFSLKEGVLALEGPMTAQKGKDRYIVTGSVGFAEREPPIFNLKFEVKEGSLPTFLALANNSLAEFQRKKIAPPEEKAKINFEELYLPNILSFRSDDSLTLYLSDGEESKLPPFFLSAFKSIEEEITEERKRKTPKFIQNVKGKFTAAGSLTGSGKDLKGSLDLKINSGIIEGYGFEELRASIDSTGKNITINSFSLIKKGGVIEAKGNIDIENKIALEVSSNDFPIDFLSKLVPGKEFEGKLDIKSEIGGTISTPEGSIAFNIGSAKADGISFDEIAGSASLVNSIFSISAEANSKGEKSMIFGNVALAGKKNMDLTASLKGEGMGLFTVFFRQLRHVHGEGEMNLRATGTLDDPQIDGKISLSDLDLYMINLRSGVYNISGNIDVKNSIAKTEGLTAVWVGEFTGMNNNDVEIKGTISLASIFKKERYIGADLAVKDNKYHIEEKAFYKGEASVKDLKLFGPVYFKETDAPEIAKLSGTIDLNDGSISLTKAGRKRAHLPIALDLTVNFGENVVVVGGEAENLISSDISNITINFEAAAEGLQLTGTWSKPDLAGDIVFGRGNIIILDREFRLLSQDEQKRYFGLNSDKIDPNHAAFSGKGTSPYINLASRTKIEVYETSPETKETKIKYVIIVARTSGTQAAPKPEDQLKTTFTSFDTDQTGAKISPASYTEDEVKLMLLPEFIKASAEDATKDKVASRGFLVEYLNSRLQMLLLRQVEKKLEQTLGLESFMLEYNFGKDLERLLPAEEVPNEPGAQKETFAVSFVKRIFDRLYIDVRYAEAMDEVKGENITYFNYELTYKLGYIWSIVYFSEPFTTAWSGYPYYKITLQGEILL